MSGLNSPVKFAKQRISNEISRRAQQELRILRKLRESRIFVVLVTFAIFVKFAVLVGIDATGYPV